MNENDKREQEWEERMERRREKEREREKVEEEQLREDYLRRTGRTKMEP